MTSTELSFGSLRELRLGANFHVRCDKQSQPIAKRVAPSRNRDPIRTCHRFGYVAAVATTNAYRQLHVRVATTGAANSASRVEQLDGRELTATEEHALAVITPVEL